MSEPSHSIDLDEALSHAPFLRRVARALVRDDQAAEDLLQETWVAAIEHPPVRAGRLRSWLTVVLKSKAHNRHRSEVRRSKREPQAARAEAVDESGALQQLEAQRQVFEQVLLLDEPSRTVIHLRYYEGLGPTEIARHLGLPLKTVKTRLYRALEKLRGKLDDEHAGGREAWVLALAPLGLPRAAALTPPTLLAGSLVMKKFLLVACALLVIGVVLGPKLASWLEPARGSEDLGPAFIAATSGSRQEREAAPEPVVAVVEREQLVNAQASLERVEGSIEVSVNWSTREPAVGVGIQVEFDAPGSSRAHLLHERTDGQGRARFDGVAAGEARVRIDREHETHKLAVGAGALAQLSLSLDDGHLVKGRVLGSDGEGVAGAGIYLENGWSLVPMFHLAQGTDEDGYFTLRAVGKRTQFGARAEGFQPSVVVEVADLAVDEAGVRNVELRLAEPGGRLHGRVVDPDGEPVAGAIIVAGSKAGWNVELTPGVRAIQAPPVRCEADESGRFEYPGDLPAGEVPVTVTSPGYPAWSREVEIPLGGALELEVRLVPGANITGRLLASDGSPVAGGKVLVAKEFAGGWFHHQVPPPTATTDEHGRFALEGIAPGAHELNATPVRAERSRGKAQWCFECASGEQLSVELVLDRGLVIEGRVVDEDGVGVAGWMVRSETLDYTQFGEVMSKSYPRSGVTDSQGHFLLANLGAGRHDLEMSPPNFYGSALARISAVEAGTVGLEVVVDREMVPDASISGTLDTLPSNARFTVRKQGERSAYFIGIDPETGRFEHGPLVAGTYQLEVAQDQVSLFVGESFELERGEHLELGLIQLSEPGAIELRLTGELPEHLGSLMISANRIGCSSSQLALEDGRFLSGDLAEGRWLLSLWQEPYFMADQVVEVRSGETTRVDAVSRLGTERRIRCRFAAAKSAWQRLDVEVHDENGDLVRAFPTIDRRELRDGLVHLHNTNFPDGSYSMHARTDTGLEGRGEMRWEGLAAQTDEWVVELE